MTAATGKTAAELLAVEERYGAHNYHPLPIVVERAEECGFTTRKGVVAYGLSQRLLGAQPRACPPEEILAATS